MGETDRAANRASLEDALLAVLTSSEHATGATLTIASKAEAEGVRCVRFVLNKDRENPIVHVVVDRHAESLSGALPAGWERSNPEPSISLAVSEKTEGETAWHASMIGHLLMEDFPSAWTATGESLKVLLERIARLRSAASQHRSQRTGLWGEIAYLSQLSHEGFVALVRGWAEGGSTTGDSTLDFSTTDENQRSVSIDVKTTAGSSRRHFVSIAQLNTSRSPLLASMLVTPSGSGLSLLDLWNLVKTQRGDLLSPLPTWASEVEDRIAELTGEVVSDTLERYSLPAALESLQHYSLSPIEKLASHPGIIGGKVELAASSLEAVASPWGRWVSKNNELPARSEVYKERLEAASLSLKRLLQA